MLIFHQSRGIFSALRLKSVFFFLNICVMLFYKQKSILKKSHAKKDNTKENHNLIWPGEAKGDSEMNLSKLCYCQWNWKVLARDHLEKRILKAGFSHSRESLYTKLTSNEFRNMWWPSKIILPVLYNSKNIFYSKELYLHLKISWNSSEDTVRKI